MQPADRIGTKCECCVRKFRVAVGTGHGRRSGWFRDRGQRLGNSDSHGVALGDWDGDRDLDPFIANGSHRSRTRSG
jgi:hypothetical protein